MSHQKILVCGGTGFVGSEIAKQLVKDGKSIRILTRKNPKNPISNVEYVMGDVFDKESLDQAMKDCDTVINAVQFKNAPFENPSKGLTYEKVDAEGTEEIVKASARNGLSRILYISGAGTAEGRTEPWFRAKIRAEKAIRNSGLIYTIFRPSWMIGPHDKSLNKFISMIRLFPIVFILGSGYRIQPLFVDDMAKMVSASINLPKAQNQVYEVGGPESLTMKEILQCVAKVLRKKRWFITVPKSVAAPFFSFLEMLPGVPVTRDALDFLTMDTSISQKELDRVNHDLGIHMKTLDSTLQNYL